MAQLVSLQQMENTVRRMTARYTEQQMTTAQIDSYINLAYTLHFPEQFKNLKLTKPYVFLTTPNVDTYDFIYEDMPTNPQTGEQITSATPGNIQITPPVYCQGYILRYYQDKTTFYRICRILVSISRLEVDSGMPQAYSGVIPSTPFYRAQLDIFGNVTEPGVIISAFTSGNSSNENYTLTDVPQTNSDRGLLYEPNNPVSVGNVNYITGVYTFTPSGSAVIDSGANIYASVVPYQSSRPTDVLFYNQQIIFRPCPQQIYEVEFHMSQQPTQLIASKALPN